MKRKQKDLPFDELVRQMVRACQRIERGTGGEVRVRLEFGPKGAAQGKNGDDHG